MRSFLLITALVSTALALPSSRPLSSLPDRIVLYPHLLVDPIDSYTWIKDKESRIVGGEEAEPHQFPFIVGLLIDNAYFCGGSILDSKTILTAAHCLDGAGTVEVIAGAHNLDALEADQQKFVTSRTRVHENWRPFFLQNDIAMAWLEDEIQFSDIVTAVDLASEDPEDGAPCTAAGWGMPADSALGRASILRYIEDLPVLNNDLCAETYGDASTGDKVCIDTTGGRGVCLGDSGGPLLNGDNEQVGITSFVASAGCESGLPHAFTSVAQFRDWIARQEPPK